MKVRTAVTLEVVICTYNNATMLDGVLSTLAGQTPDETACWSCLVVDNNCNDDTPNVVRRHVLAGTIPGLRSVQEPEQGLTPARLRGVNCSTAQWIAFVDDDCFLKPDWIAQATAFAESHSAVGAFGGRVALDWEVEPPPYVKSYGYCFAEQNRGDSAHQVTFLAGAGLVVNRSALSACGWIDAPLLADRVGEKLVSGGDVEIVLRIAGIGRELWYVPQCVLHHRIPERRISPRYLKDINRNLGISQALADALVSDGSISRWLFASVSKFPKQTLSLAKVTLDAARRRKPWTEISVQASFRLGQLQGILRILTMSPSRRRELLGRARPRTRPGEAG
ncbi:MAG TPA: glycosyltransferase [Candidatus Acidoferrum sp.]|jgi:GT2 family glycosyltransferase